MSTIAADVSPGLIVSVKPGCICNLLNCLALLVAASRAVEAYAVVLWLFPALRIPAGIRLLGAARTEHIRSPCPIFPQRLQFEASVLELARSDKKLWVSPTGVSYGTYRTVLHGAKQAAEGSRGKRRKTDNGEAAPQARVHEAASPIQVAKAVKVLPNPTVSLCCITRPGADVHFFTSSLIRAGTGALRLRGGLPLMTAQSLACSVF